MGNICQQLLPVVLQGLALALTFGQLGGELVEGTADLFKFPWPPAMNGLGVILLGQIGEASLQSLQWAAHLSAEPECHCQQHQNIQAQKQKKGTAPDHTQMSILLVAQNLLVQD